MRKNAAVLVVPLMALLGCRSSDTQGVRGMTPYSETPCTASPSPGARAVESKLAWRTETMEDGSVRATIGDIDAAPRTPGTVRLADYRAPGAGVDCAQIKILTVRGWWCTTTVSPVIEHGEIVVGGAEPRARLDAAGFRTICSSGAPNHRAHYEFQRDSWSGYRPYAEREYTAWTRRPGQTGPAVNAACPRGRVGTYNYRLAVALEFTGYLGLADTEASGRTLRQDCGTGMS